MPSNYVVYYFDFPGRAEVIRLTLSALGQEFKDVRLSHDEWVQKYKSQMPLNKVPILKVNNDILFETSAIIRYLGAKHGISGNTDIDAARCDAVVFVVDEYIGKFLGAVFSSQEGRKERALTFTKNELPNLDASLQKIAGLYGKNGHIITDKLTYADLYIYSFYCLVYMYTREKFQFKFAAENRKLVEALPALKEYFKKQPSMEEVWRKLDSI
ncbi:hypothetical protein ACOME3_009304 [Neoechinorhynchus agilis]